MTIGEAAGLVLRASSLGRGGEVFVLDMGEPVRIVDLAEDLIRQSGYVLGKDIEIAFSGIRPGEKLREELVSEWEQPEQTADERIMSLKNSVPVPDMLSTIEELERAARTESPEQLRARLAALVPEGRPAATSQQEAGSTVCPADTIWQNTGTSESMNKG